MNRLKYAYLFVILLASAVTSCKKDDGTTGKDYVYYEVGFRTKSSDWRDTSFIVRTNNQQLIQQVVAQLAKPIDQRQLVFGTLAAGSGGYNRNAAHVFQWHFKEDDWSLVDVTAEIYDGRPYSDIDKEISYWMDTVKRYGSWGSFIRKQLPSKP